MNDFLSKLQNLSPEKRELVLRRLKAQKEARIKESDKKDPQIRRISRNQDIPLSFAQQRLWFLDQLEGASGTYNIPLAFRLTGNLDLHILEQAFTAIIQRHEILRTSFKNVNGVPVQVIDPKVKLTLPLIDLQTWAETEQEAEVERLIQEDAHKPFNLSQNPLIRATLLQLRQDSHILLFNMHHIVSDGWSMGIFIQELSAFYRAFCSGELSPLPDLPIQYADFAYWQRQYLSGEVLERQLDYWKGQLADIPPLLELPTDRPRPPEQTFCGRNIPIEIDSDLTKQLKTLSQQSGTTLFMTLLAAFAVLLDRYSGQKDILVGSPIANRNRAEIESLIGFFVNTLVLRVQLEDNPSFEAVLKQVRQMALEAYAHQDLPFEQLVEALQPERNLSQTPLFQVMFVLQNAPIETLELPNLNFTPVEQKNEIAKFDLSLSLEETEEGLKGNWQYNSDLFDRATIERMSGHFQTLLRGIVANPKEGVAQLPLLCEAERQQLLVEWNNTQTDYPQDKCIHELFEEQVERTPNNIAVVFEDEQLTYGELNTCANQLAHYLESLGVGPEVLVGICLERSIDMVIGLLGILKAGGAYVPLDPAYPQERLAYMLSDAQIKVLLTQHKLLTDLPINQETEVICLDNDWTRISAESKTNPFSRVDSQNLAYIIYTSGSTGNPKGVMISHQSLVNFALTSIVNYKLTYGDRILQFASISFDASVEEIYPSLICGASLILRTEEMIGSIAIFIQKCWDWKLTVLDLPTAYWHQMADELEATGQALPESLRLVIIGGEQALPEKVRSWQKSVKGSLQLVNTYGPTEGTVVATMYQFPKTSEEEIPLAIVPIGRPLNNVQIYVLDEREQLVPIGVPGELYLGGTGLALGYLNRPDLTKEKFIPNPFDKFKVKSQKSKLYKTGDLCRYLPDGNIEYLGRIDNQVKIRGFRIELGEIEAILSQHSQVREAVVVVRETRLGSKSLVAYIIPAVESLSTSNLKAYLKEQVPEYMVPSAFVWLDSLPLTPNGKVDRRALPVPDSLRRDIEQIFVPPRNTLEIRLAQIWSEILDINPIGVRDNFFQLGGHSLLAVRLMAQIKQEFGKNLSLVTLFKSQTIEDLATLLSSSTDSLPWSPLVPIHSEGAKLPFFCVPGAGGNVLYFYELARHLDVERPFYGLQALGLDGKSQPHTTIEEMAAYYLDAIKSVQPQGPYLLGGHSLGGHVAFEMAQQLQKQGNEVALLAIIDSPAPVLKTKPASLDRDKNDALWLIELAKLIESWLGKNLAISYEAIESLSFDEQLIHFQEYLQEIDVLPAQSDIAQVRGLVNVFKANQQVHYLPHDIYPTKIVLFQASEFIEEVSNSELSPVFQEPSWGWNQFSSHPVENLTIPGNHMSMMSQPHVQVLAQQLKLCLDDV